MTPDLLTLSRAVVALSGAPRIPRVFGVHRDGLGLLWLSDKDDEESVGAVPDLTDDATAGVMLCAFPFAVKVVTRTEPKSFRLMWLEEDGEGLGPRQHTTGWCDWLGEAVARVMVARGRWA